MIGAMVPFPCPHCGRALSLFVPSGAPRPGGLVICQACLGGSVFDVELVSESKHSPRSWLDVTVLNERLILRKTDERDEARSIPPPATRLPSISVTVGELLQERRSQMVWHLLGRRKPRVPVWA